MRDSRASCYLAVIALYHPEPAGPENESYLGASFPVLWSGFVCEPICPTTDASANTVSIVSIAERGEGARVTTARNTLW